MNSTILFYSVCQFTTGKGSLTLKLESSLENLASLFCFIFKSHVCSINIYFVHFLLPVAHKTVSMCKNNDICCLSVAPKAIAAVTLCHMRMLANSVPETNSH